jgi:hypothetical protein
MAASGAESACAEPARGATENEDEGAIQLLSKRPETTLHFQARIAGEILQDAQSYFRTRPKDRELNNSPV